jgi:hypothetical protein
MVGVLLCHVPRSPGFLVRRECARALDDGRVAAVPAPGIEALVPCEIGHEVGERLALKGKVAGSPADDADAA